MLEAGLRGIWLKSRLLAAFLSEEEGLAEMSDVVRRLGVQVEDVPLLLAAASTHSPGVTARYGVGLE